MSLVLLLFCYLAGWNREGFRPVPDHELRVRRASDVVDSGLYVDDGRAWFGGVHLDATDNRHCQGASGDECGVVLSVVCDLGRGDVEPEEVVLAGRDLYGGDCKADVVCDQDSAG